MSRPSAMLLTTVLLFCSTAARADDADLTRKIETLEGQVKDLRARLDGLGAVSTTRQVVVADPVFIGAGGSKPNSLSMDNASINCPSHSFVTAVQILKTGNTVTQVRYACRGIE